MKKVIIFCLTIYSTLPCLSQVKLEREQNGGGNYTFRFNNQMDLINTFVASTAKGIDEGAATRPRLSTFIEYGDGYFGDTIPIIKRPVYNWTNYNPLGVTYAIYTRKPPTIATDFDTKSSPVADALVPDASVQNFLTRKSIDIKPSIGTLIPNDLMSFAVPFKFTRSFINIETGKQMQRRKGRKYVIILYNKKTGQPLFEPMPESGIIDHNNRLRPDFDINDNTVTFTAIRGLTPQMQVTSDLGGIENSGEALTAINDYNNKFIIAFDADFTGDNIEHNIFFSLLTASKEEVFIDNNGPAEATVRAILIDGDFSESQEITLQSSSDLTSHDPNGISAWPNCLKPDKEMRSQNFHFNVTFTNDGEGDAHTILIKPLIDSNRALLLKNVSQIMATLGKTVFTLTKDNVTITPQNWTHDSGLLVLNFGDTLSFSGRPLFYPAKKYLLKGLHGSSIFSMDMENEGSISFTLKGIVPANAVEANSYVGIYFDKNPIYQPETPFKIKVSDDCDKKPVAKCCYYWWLPWLLLAIIVLLLFYIILKRRRRN